MRPVFRLPSEASLSHVSETDLRLFVAHQKYNVRSRRLAERELRRRMMLTEPSLSSHAEAPPPQASISRDRPRGSLADIAWLGVILGAGALALHIVSWWAGL